MQYESLTVYNDTLDLLVRVSKLSEAVEVDHPVPELSSLKEELVETMTCIFRACERPENEDQFEQAVEHMVKSKIWIRVLLETHTVSRYVYKQLNSLASSIINDLMIGPDGF